MKFVQGFYPTIVNWPRALSVLSKQVTTEVALTCFCSHGGPLGCLWASPAELSPEPATDWVGALGLKPRGETLPYSPVPRAREVFCSCSHFLGWLYRCVSGRDL